MDYKVRVAELCFSYDRDYFTNVRTNRTWDYQGDHFFVDPVYSRATGSQQVILSMLLPSSSKERPDWVASMDLRAYSLVQTVLPDALGYGYCVIDNDGKVLFHSDDSRNLVENFFREADNNSA